MPSKTSSPLFFFSNVVKWIFKWTKHQSRLLKKTVSWDNPIINARLEIAFILEDSPSLKNGLPSMIDSAYEYTKEKAILETKLATSSFPQTCPWTLSEILSN